MTDTATELATTTALSKAVASGALTPEQYDDYQRGVTPRADYRHWILALSGVA